MTIATTADSFLGPIRVVRQLRFIVERYDEFLISCGHFPSFPALCSGVHESFRVYCGEGAICGK